MKAAASAVERDGSPWEPANDNPVANPGLVVGGPDNGSFTLIGDPCRYDRGLEEDRCPWLLPLGDPN